MSIIDNSLKRILRYPGVIGYIIFNKEGIPIRTGLDNATAVKYVGLLNQLIMTTRSTIRDIDPQDDVKLLRIWTQKYEIMVATEEEYLMIVIQKPTE
ncbi:hypothetical protein PO909_021372 [Leuciscus waleckii]